jgi:hypothetical protein
LAFSFYLTVFIAGMNSYNAVFQYGNKKYSVGRFAKQFYDKVEELARTNDISVSIGSKPRLVPEDLWSGLDRVVEAITDPIIYGLKNAVQYFIMRFCKSQINANRWLDRMCPPLLNDEGEHIYLDLGAIFVKLVGSIGYLLPGGRLPFSRLPMKFLENAIHASNYVTRFLSLGKIYFYHLPYDKMIVPNTEEWADGDVIGGLAPLAIIEDLLFIGGVVFLGLKLMAPIKLSSAFAGLGVNLFKWTKLAKNGIIDEFETEYSDDTTETQTNIDTIKDTLENLLSVVGLRLRI